MIQEHQEMLAQHLRQAYRSAVQAELDAAGLREVSHPLLLCILFLAVYMLVVRINTRRAFLANRVMRDQNMSFSFYADRFEVEYSGGHAVIPFDQLFALWETDTNFYLMLSPNQGYALSREGCNEDLAAFLRTKNAKKI